MTELKITVPDTLKFTLAGDDYFVKASEIASTYLEQAITNGLQRVMVPHMKHDGKLLSGKSDKVVRQKQGEALIAKLKSGERLGQRASGGRTVDPIKREMKRIANAEVDASMPRLLKHHGNISRKVFDSKYRSQYVDAVLKEDHERLAKLAKDTLAKVGGGEVKLLNIAA